MKAHRFQPVTVVCDDCGAELGHTAGSPYMQGTIIIRPELVRTHVCPGKPMCACGHTKDSHTPGDCVGCTGPECEAACTCTGVGLRLKLAVLTSEFQHSTGCKANTPQDVRPAPLWHDGYCLSHGERGCEWCEEDDRGRD